MIAVEFVIFTVICYLAHKQGYHEGYDIGYSKGFDDGAEMTVHDMNEEERPYWYDDDFPGRN